MGLKGWHRVCEFLLLSLETWVQFPALPWWLTTIWSSSSKKSDALFWLLQALAHRRCVFRHSGTRTPNKTNAFQQFSKHQKKEMSKLGRKIWHRENSVKNQKEKGNPRPRSPDVHLSEQRPCRKDHIQAVHMAASYRSKARSDTQAESQLLCAC